MNKLLSGRRLLVVEDEMMLLMNTEDMLSDLGCESVTAAATIDEALALIDTQPFDAAMLDMNLGGEMTQSVADALAARGVPFMFATGYEIREMSNGYRDQPLLKKPFQATELFEILAHLIPQSAVQHP